mmetsp:Transcript_14246/g.28594  ORF Transcript_14246/g.28594 Transcript_14246/m.28594 type:complete len:201 (+) Transcript_14246:2485-3087(+)
MGAFGGIGSGVGRIRGRWGTFFSFSNFFFFFSFVGGNTKKRERRGTRERKRKRSDGSSSKKRGRGDAVEGSPCTQREEGGRRECMQMDGLGWNEGKGFSFLHSSSVCPSVHPCWFPLESTVFSLFPACCLSVSFHTVLFVILSVFHSFLLQVSWSLSPSPLIFLSLFLLFFDAPIHFSFRGSIHPFIHLSCRGRSRKSVC